MNQQPHAHEGAEAHTHPPRPLNPNAAIRMDGPVPADLTPIEPVPAQPPFNMNEAVMVGAQEWLAREFVGGLLAIADAQGTERADFLADKCVLLAHRLANAESESRVLGTQLQALATENNDLHRKIDDCGCHESEEAEAALSVADNEKVQQSQPTVVIDVVPGTQYTSNGDHA